MDRNLGRLLERRHLWAATPSALDGGARPVDFALLLFSCPCRPVAKTLGFQPEKESSILSRDTKSFWDRRKAGTVFCKDGHVGALPTGSTNFAIAAEVEEVRRFVANEEIASSNLASRSNSLSRKERAFMNTWPRGKGIRLQPERPQFDSGRVLQLKRLT